MRNEDCARHPYREARRFFLCPETEPERRGLLENSKPAMGQRSSSQGLYRCADSSGKHAERRGGGADGYKEAYTGQPTDQSGNLFTSSGLFWKIEHIIPPTHPNPAPAAPRRSRPLVPLCQFGIRTLWLGPVRKGRLPSERGAELILKVPAGRQREGGGGGRGSGIPAPPPLLSALL